MHQTCVKFNAEDQDKTWAVFKPYREGDPFTTVATITCFGQSHGHREEIDLTWADVSRATPPKKPNSTMGSSRKTIRSLFVPTPLRTSAARPQTNTRRADAAGQATNR